MYNDEPLIARIDRLEREVAEIKAMLLRPPKSAATRTFSSDISAQEQRTGMRGYSSYPVQRQSK